MFPIVPSRCDTGHYALVVERKRCTAGSSVGGERMTMICEVESAGFMGQAFQQ